MSSTKLLCLNGDMLDFRWPTSALQVTKMLVSIFGTSKTLGHRWNLHPSCCETTPRTTEHHQVIPDCRHSVKLTPSWPTV